MPSELSRDWVKRIPTDIWRLVFGICVEEDSNSPLFATQKSPFLLTHVCSTWRSIATSAPELWCTIKRYVDTEGRISLNRDLIKLSLLYSGDSPLSIQVVDDPQSRLFSSLNNPLLVDIFEEIHRITRLELSAPFIHPIIENPVQGLNLQCSPKRACSLEELIFIYQPDYENQNEFESPFNDSQTISMWADSPKLHTLIIRGCIEIKHSWDLRSIYLSDYFPIRRLTTLEMGFLVSVEDLFFILAETKRLVQCKFETITGHLPNQNTPAQPLLLVAIEYLDLGGCSAFDEVGPGPPLTIILQYLVTPSMRSLNLRCDRDWSLLSFTSFLRQSSCDIRHLSFDIENSSEAEKIECLQLLPSLQSLDMRTYIYRRRVPGDPDILTQLFANSMGAWDAEKEEFGLCPNLQYLQVEHDTLFCLEKHNSVFADMIEARWRRPSRTTGSTLKKVEVWNFLLDDYEFDCELIRLLILKREGFDVTIDPPPMFQDAFCRPLM